MQFIKNWTNTIKATARRISPPHPMVSAVVAAFNAVAYVYQAVHLRRAAAHCCNQPTHRRCLVERQI